MHFIVKFKTTCMKFLLQIWILYILDIIEYMCLIYAITVLCLPSIFINTFINNNKKTNFKTSIADILLKCVYKYVIRKYKNCIRNKIKKTIVLFFRRPCMKWQYGQITRYFSKRALCRQNSPPSDPHQSISRYLLEGFFCFCTGYL